VRFGRPRPRLVPVPAEPPGHQQDNNRGEAAKEPSRMAFCCRARSRHPPRRRPGDLAKQGAKDQAKPDKQATHKPYWQQQQKSQQIHDASRSTSHRNERRPGGPPTPKSRYAATPPMSEDLDRRSMRIPQPLSCPVNMAGFGRDSDISETASMAGASRLKPPLRRTGGLGHGS
jgi:hypothetical protein